MTPSGTTLALANLDFELELAEGPNYKTRASMLRLGERWGSILRLLPEAREAECLLPEALRDGFEFAGPASSLLVWGVTERVRALALRLGLGEAEFPSEAAVLQANDKLVSHELEQRLGVALPGSVVISSVEQLRSVVEECPYDWVIKHPLGFSALERMVGKAGVLSHSPLGFARIRLEKGWKLLFEPWVEGSRGFSHHYQIARDGSFVFVGECGLLTDPGGVHRGNRITQGESDPRLLEVGGRVCGEMAALGYWGPLGLDGLEGTLGGEQVFRPLLEINARYSFGRLTLALRDWIPEGWTCTWWHPRAVDAERLPAVLSPLPSLAEGPWEAGLYALPACADPGQSSGTALLIAPTLERLTELEHQYLPHYPTAARA